MTVAVLFVLSVLFDMHAHFLSTSPFVCMRPHCYVQTLLLFVGSSQVLRIMRLVPECAVDLLGSDDCDFAVAVASVIYGAETDQSDAQKQKQGAPGTLPPLDMGKWCGDRLCRKDKETFATRVLSFVQVGIFLELYA